ncbi:MAG: ABC transporter permease [Ilumatobacter sp.]|uniref:ABC transporter permease n=1 Tax=Ilumatobacter sp. TaxID=1967498 RepID=UPI003297804B
MTISDPSLDSVSNPDDGSDLPGDAPDTDRRPIDPERIGLAGLVLAGLLLVLVGTRLVTGVVSVIALALTLGTIVMLVVTAVLGGPEARRKIAPYGLLKPGMLWLALFYLAPLVTLLRNSLSTLPSRFAVKAEFDWNFGNYSTAFSDFGGQFGRGFGYAAVATILTILLGYPLAYVIAFRGGKYRGLLLGLIIIPFFTSYLIRTIAWQSLLADTGPIPNVLDAIGVQPLLDAVGIMDGDKILNTPAAVIGGLTYNFLPFMALPIYVSLEKINLNLVDAAKDLYSGSVRAFFKIVFPLSLPGVFAGTLLTFIPASGDFVNQQYLGNPNTSVIGQSIQNQFLVQNNLPVASAMSFVLMAIITVFVVIYSRFFGTDDLA